MLDRELQNMLAARITANKYRPVLLHGVKGSGKTTLAGMFAKQFSQSVMFDLSEPADRRHFDTRYVPKLEISELFFLRSRAPLGARSLLFLDNLQEMPGALDALLAASPRPGNVMILAATDVMGCRMPDASALPPPAPPSGGGSTSSRIRHPDTCILHPVSFREFLRALGETEALSGYDEVPCPDHAHQRLLKLFHRYALIGGMPEIVASWAETPNLMHLGRIYERILSGWEELLGQESPGRKSGATASGILADAFPYAGSRITFNRFGNRPLRSREAATGFRLLERMMMLSLIYPVTGTEPGTPPDTGRSPRLQFTDTGMVIYFSGIRQQVADAADLSTLFGGQILRHIAGQELASSDPGSQGGIGFWARGKTQSSAETDFILPYRDLLIPVSARSGEPGRLRSLHQFIDAASHPYAVRLSADRLNIRKTQTLSGKPFYLLSLPYYLAGRIREHLDGFVKFVGE